MYKEEADLPNAVPEWAAKVTEQLAGGSPFTMDWQLNKTESVLLTFLKVVKNDDQPPYFIAKVEETADEPVARYVAVSMEGILTELLPKDRAQLD